ncbi:phosphonate ABC transporter, permease protein PhnE [Paenirhodobacter populi]|uniref:Phosphonate ABC transporter, permease protein PhnE n=1 Tax=Paenirhodobacter populi TaxID=2306993 RepID=A0A443J7N2_9RHOB|nr:phosphonate ABC transporter, permease protein PhnE [Sinirhodobacter populi]RWR16499.1 phosphonate ABC transporter, permease protein PhnE [Sinirhodobacter populi]
MTHVSDAIGRVEAARRAQMRRTGWKTLLFGGALAVLIGLSLHQGEVSWTKFITGLPRFGAYIIRILPDLSFATLGADLQGWMWNLPNWLKLLFDTVLIAFVSTVMGAIIAFFLSFPAARNMGFGRVSTQLARRFFEFLRTVPELVFALLFVFAFGLGPMAGVLAITLHTAGVLGKMMSEINETITDRSLEGVIAAGASRDRVIRLGVVPQVAPAFVSYILLRFEINVRSASVIGLVGAGGIGQELMFVINQFIYRDISAILALLIVTVAIVDIVSETIRHRIIASEVSHASATPSAH